MTEFGADTLKSMALRGGALCVLDAKGMVSLVSN